MTFAEHLERFHPDSVHEDFTSARAEAQKLMPGFGVRRIAPASSGKPWIYATNGAATAVGDDEDGAEYVVLAPAADPVLVEMLAALATVNADPHKRLGVGSIVNLGRPWTGSSAAQNLLVLPPYIFGAGFEVYQPAGEDRRVVVLWLVPITSAEARYVRLHGVQAFEGLMQRSEANVADPRRAPIV
ncbi:MAG: suppressor of fused domain protein [Actinomycetota bacterium]|nr:suppressor of fused domain protein [Actinomycetota bacterium]